MELLSTVILPYDLFFFFSLSSKPTTVCIFVFHISVRVFLIIDYLFTHAPYMDNTSVKKGATCFREHNFCHFIFVV